MSYKSIADIKVLQTIVRWHFPTIVLREDVESSPLHVYMERGLQSLLIFGHFAGFCTIVMNLCLNGLQHPLNYFGNTSWGVAIPCFSETNIYKIPNQVTPFV